MPHILFGHLEAIGYVVNPSAKFNMFFLMFYWRVEFIIERLIDQFCCRRHSYDPRPHVRWTTTCTTMHWLWCCLIGVGEDGQILLFFILT